MKIEISNGAVQVSNNEITPRCISINLHATSREVEVDARHRPARLATDEHDGRDAYIYINVKADERDYEVPQDERGSFRRTAVEQNLYLDVDDARALLDALQKALDCAEQTIMDPDRDDGFRALR